MTGPHTERAHAKLGASGAHRWMNCPGSIRLSEGIEDVTTIYAAEGTAAHELGERVLRSFFEVAGGRSAADFIGERIVVGNHVFEVDEAMAEAVQVYFDTVRAEFHPGCELHIEKRFSLETIRAGMFGTNDALVYDRARKRLIVFDYKHGQGYAVEAEENPQLLYYGLGAALEHGWPIDTVELVIVQPRAPHKDGPVRRWATDALALIGWAEELRAAAEATDDPLAPLRPGSWCKFCPAAGVCPALRERARAIARDEFAEPPEGMSVSELAAVLVEAELVRDWVAAVAAEAFRRVQAGETVPGYKLVQKRAVRRWNREDQDVLARELQDRFGLDDEELYRPRELRTPAQLEKAIPKAFRPELTEYVDKVSSGVTLARTEDRRAEVSPEGRTSAAYDFA